MHPVLSRWGTEGISGLHGALNCLTAVAEMIPSEQSSLHVSTMCSCYMQNAGWAPKSSLPSVLHVSLLLY